MTSDRATSGSQTSLREANRARIVESVKRHGGLTQVELVSSTGLSPATVSSIVKELTTAGVVDTAPTSRSGRRAQQVTLARNLGLVAGVQFSRRQLRVALADFSGQMVAEQHMPLAHDHRVDAGLDRATLLISDLLESISSSLDELKCIGIGIEAPIDIKSGRVAVAGLLRGWENVDIADMMSVRMGKPVVLDNDANLGALAEYRAVAARGYDSCAYIRASYGVGAGLVFEGEIFHGHAGTAGEIGHIRVDEGGPICRCGNRGCLETVVGANALVDLLRGSHGNLTLRDVIHNAIEGDPGCRRVIADAGRQIGVVAAELCNVFNPHVLIVGGELAETGELLIDAIRDVLERGLLPNSVTQLEVRQSELGEQAEILGALALALDSVTVLSGLEV